MLEEQAKIDTGLKEKEVSIRISELFMDVVRTDDERLINKPDESQIQERALMNVITYGVKHDEIVFRQFHPQPEDTGTFDLNRITVTTEDERVIVNISQGLVEGIARWNRGREPKYGNPEDESFNYTRDKATFDEIAGKLDFEYRKI